MKQDEKEEETLKELFLFVGEPKYHDPQNVVNENMKVVKLAPQIMHESGFVEDIFLGDLDFEEEVEILTTEVAPEKLRKDEYQDKSMRIE
jgi:hypothetical protein